MGFFDNAFGKPRYRSSSKEVLPDFQQGIQINEISEYFKWIFNRNVDIRNACAFAIHNALKTVSHYNNKELYNSFRRVNLSKIDLTFFSNFDDEIQQSLFCVASMNANGFVREKALKFLIKSSSKLTYSFILFRLADWVPSIRKLAESGIRQNLKQQNAHFLIQHYKSFEWLLKIERADLSVINQDIVDFIFSDKNTDQIIENIQSYEEGERFFLFRNLIARNKLDNKVTQQLLTDNNYLIRLLAIRSIDLKDNIDILRILLKDRNQIIRAYAINQVLESQIVQLVDDLKTMIFDSSATVREVSRNLLSKANNYDFPEVYRLALVNNSTTGTIVGLSEVGLNSDLDRIMEFLESKSSRIRAAALYAVSNLDYQKSKEYAFEMLNDSSNKVKKICLSIIPRDKSVEDLSRLRNIYDQGTNDVKVYILKILSSYGGWGIAGDLLKGIGESNEAISQLASSLFHKWYYYSLRLGTAQTEYDKLFVMNIYRNIDWENRYVPKNVEKLIKEIPFIFANK